MSTFLPSFAALDHAGVRFVVVGGLAVVLHGYPRLTADIDLVVDPSPDATARAIDALTASGLRPRAPVDARAFADRETRRRWRDEKGLVVFSLVDPANPLREVDLFCEPPIDFEDLWREAADVVLAGTTIRVASIAHLIAMKRDSGRPQDLADIAALEEIARRRGR